MPVYVNGRTRNSCTITRLLPASRGSLVAQLNVGNRLTIVRRPSQSILSARWEVFTSCACSKVVFKYSRMLAAREM